MLKPFLAGVYRHYKGPLYLVLGYGRDSNYEGRTVVVYIGLQLDDAKPGPRINVRTAEEFFGMVATPTGKVPRFSYAGPEWQPPIS